MANIFSIHSVGESIVKQLRNSYPESLRLNHSCEFRLLSSGELEETTPIPTTVTLYLYRIEQDKHLRNLPDKQKPAPLALCLYYLVTIWANDALTEHTITAWVMSQLHQHPFLDMSKLSNSGGCDSSDQIQIVPIDMSNEEMMQLWGALTPSYRLSLPYLVRIVAIDPDSPAIVDISN